MVISELNHKFQIKNVLAPFHESLDLPLTHQLYVMMHKSACFPSLSDMMFAHEAEL